MKCIFPELPFPWLKHVMIYVVLQFLWGLGVGGGGGELVLVLLAEGFGGGVGCFIPPPPLSKF